MACLQIAALLKVCDSLLGDLVLELASNLWELCGFLSWRCSEAGHREGGGVPLLGSSK